MSSPSASSSSRRPSSSSVSASSVSGSSSSVLTSPSDFPSATSISELPGGGFPSFSPRPHPSGSAAQQCGGPNNPCQMAPPAALYLYTFLSTLIVLLLVSGAIVMRSLILRRRQLRNGTWAPPGMRVGPEAMGRRRRENPFAKMPRPKMYDVYLDGGKEDAWAGLQPFYAASLDSTPPPLPTATVAPPPAVPPHAPSVAVPLRQRIPRALRNLFAGPPGTRDIPLDPVVSPSAEKTAAVASPPAEGAELTSVRVGILVAMPVPPVEPDEDKEPEVPYLELGMLDASVSAGSSARASSSRDLEDDKTPLETEDVVARS